MGRSSVRGEGTRKGVPHARELGWDDGLYDDAPSGGTDDPARPAGATAPAGAAGAAGTTEAAEAPGAADAVGGGGRGHRRGRAGGGRRRAGAGAGGTGGPGGRSGKGGKRRVLRWSASVLSLLILGTAGAGYLYYEHLNDKIKKDDLTLGKNMPEHKANAAGQTPLNILLIGSDARDNKANQDLGGGRDTFDGPPLADVQMLVHLSADRSNISVVSMPRDTMLKIPECRDSNGKVYRARQFAQTNESLDRGGPGCTVATWVELTGIPIDHFMMIDFAGVVSMADAVGGVPVCVDKNIESRTSDGKGSGLKLARGTHPIKGEQALQWLRTRYGWVGGTDLERAKAQHMYMNSMVRELRKNAKLTDPNKLRKLAEAATDALTVDNGLDTIGKLYDLAEELKSVPTGRITMTTMPNFYSTRQAGKVEPTPGEAEELFRMIREDIPLDGKPSKRAKPAASKDPAAAPAETAVTVRNGTYTDQLGSAQGRATTVAGLLEAKGYTRAKADTLTPRTAKTTVQFPSADLEGDAQAVAKALGIPAGSVKKTDQVTGITLVVGADWREGDTYPKPKATGKAPGSNTSRADQSGCMTVDPNFTW
ncbi:LCP family protein [Streptomyces ficellus]|uniref:LytR family transcriptional regulator n=1 Tax=Streptomyces ficellus TaxID=1977088 RepID=A0A6I6FB26_9ACTN|nr:LCP family protein [Streptomyces ficellus]QGV80291.1 LytR family transcriptional regulator [Streptomyces ficellus]